MSPMSTKDLAFRKMALEILRESPLFDRLDYERKGSPDLPGLIAAPYDCATRRKLNVLKYVEGLLKSNGALPKNK